MLLFLWECTMIRHPVFLGVDWFFFWVALREWSLLEVLRISKETSNRVILCRFGSYVRGFRWERIWAVVGLFDFVLIFLFTVLPDMHDWIHVKFQARREGRRTRLIFIRVRPQQHVVFSQVSKKFSAVVKEQRCPSKRSRLSVWSTGRWYTFLLDFFVLLLVLLFSWWGYFLSPLFLFFLLLLSWALNYRGRCALFFILLCFVLFFKWKQHFFLSTA